MMPTTGIDLLAMLGLFALAGIFAYHAPRYLVSQPDFNRHALAALLILEALAFYFAFYTTPPELEPLIVASARAARKVDQYAAQKVGHLRAVHSTWF